MPGDPDELEGVEVDAELADVEIADSEAVVEPELMTVVRSSVNVPELMCCWRVASTAAELGATVAKAQMTFCCVSEFACKKD